MNIILIPLHILSVTPYRKIWMISEHKIAVYSNLYASTPLIGLTYDAVTPYMSPWVFRLYFHGIFLSSAILKH